MSPQYFVMKGNVVAKIFTIIQVQVRLNHVVICDVHRDISTLNVLFVF